MTSTDQVLIFDADPKRAASIVTLLEQSRSSTKVGEIRVITDLKSQGYGPSAGIKAIQAGQVALALVVESEVFAGLREAARQNGVATLLVVDGLEDFEGLSGRVQGYDDWVALEAIDRELAIRAAGLLRLHAEKSRRLPAVDPKFLALVVHDLRTPLNVIGLTIRAITQTVPKRSAELDEDLAFLTDNARQIEKMLAQLGDYCRLIEGESQVSSTEFDPRRFLADFLEDRRGRPGSSLEPAHVRLELADDGPAEVSLDPHRVRLALQHALANAINAAGDAPIRLRSGGVDGRWTLELIVDRPPPPTVNSIELQPERFERLAGSAAERRGLDLAIAARISEMFGGSARLDVEPGRGSTIVLDWPDRQSTS